MLGRGLGCLRAGGGGRCAQFPAPLMPAAACFGPVGAWVARAGVLWVGAGVGGVRPRSGGCCCFERCSVTDAGRCGRTPPTPSPARRTRPTVHRGARYGDRPVVVREVRIGPLWCRGLHSPGARGTARPAPTGL